jgi:hypothetical protein
MDFGENSHNIPKLKHTLDPPTTVKSWENTAVSAAFIRI